MSWLVSRHSTVYMLSRWALQLESESAGCDSLKASDLHTA